MSKATDSVAQTSYINCSNQSLSSPPFTLHARVIVYCSETQRHKWNKCLRLCQRLKIRLRSI